MTRAFAPGLQIKRKTVVRRLRELPVTGEVLVEVGQYVEADQVVARASLEGELFIFRIAEQLGIETFEVVNGLKVAEGETIKKGQLICEHRGLFGLFNSRYFAPEDGVVEFISKRTGHLGVRAPSEMLDIEAYISGSVVEVDVGKSVLIETEASFIQGIFGVGGERRGVLKCLSVPLDHELTDLDIPDDCAGSVLVGGTKPQISAITKAAELGACGIVTGSIDDQTLKAYLGYDLGIALTGDEQVPLTLIVTEGFGFIPLAKRIMEMCRELEGSAVSINGATQVRAGAMRPEIIIPRAGNVCNFEDLDSQDLEKGLVEGGRVRLLRVPYFGKLATVLELPQQKERIETGAYARVLRVKIDHASVVTIPRANVELL